MIEKFEGDSVLVGCPLYMEVLGVSDDEVVAHGMEMPEPALGPDDVPTEEAN